MLKIDKKGARSLSFERGELILPWSRQLSP